MKQKILIRVTMTDDKTRAKAMKRAVQFTGVTGVEIKGDHRNQIEVTGDEVDMISLTKKIRKKVAFAELVSVSKVEPPKAPEGDKKGGDKKDGDKKDGDKKDGDKKDGDKKDGDKKDGDKKKEEEKKLEPCCYPWPYGDGVPSIFPYPCHPQCCYVGEPVYDQEPDCKLM